MKHDHESNSWKHESSFDWIAINGVCFIIKDDVIYFVGGTVGRYRRFFIRLGDVCRYDIKRKTFEKIADLKGARSWAHGAAAHGKIFVIGGEKDYCWVTEPDLMGTCEVYNETTDEWQVIAGLKIPRGFSQGCVFGMTSVDDKLYAVSAYSGRYYNEKRTLFRRKHSEICTYSAGIECYDPDKNEWSTKIEFPDRYTDMHLFSMRVFKGSEFLRKVSPPLRCHKHSQSESKNQEPPPDIEDKKKCLVM